MKQQFGDIKMNVNQEHHIYFQLRTVPYQNDIAIQGTSIVQLSFGYKRTFIN